MSRTAAHVLTALGLCVAVLVATPGVATAARAETRPYSQAAGGLAECQGGTNGLGTVCFPVAQGETHVDLEVIDDVFEVSAVRYYFWRNHAILVSETLCDAGTVSVPAGAQLLEVALSDKVPFPWGVFCFRATDDPGYLTSIATKGTVAATFHP
ncbi:MAG: hypothetical protein HYU28_01385 [Actinobacteria bacterium]|nr:hypothetical protein [Actinomycetota bacterium]